MDDLRWTIQSKWWIHPIKTVKCLSMFLLWEKCSISVSPLSNWNPCIKEMIILHKLFRLIGTLTFSSSLSRPSFSDDYHFQLPIEKSRFQLKKSIFGWYIDWLLWTNRSFSFSKAITDELTERKREKKKIIIMLLLEWFAKMKKVRSNDDTRQTNEWKDETNERRAREGEKKRLHLSIQVSTAIQRPNENWKWAIREEGEGCPSCLFLSLSLCVFSSSSFFSDDV